MWAAFAAISWVIWTGCFTDGIHTWGMFRMVQDVTGVLTWYLLGFLVGVVQVVALVEGLQRVRWWSCMLMAWWWLFMVLAQLQTTAPSPGLVLYAVMALINHYSVFKLRTAT